MDSVGRLLLVLGLVLIGAGIGFLLVPRLGSHRLLGDIVIRRHQFTLYLPFGLMILLQGTLREVNDAVVAQHWLFEWTKHGQPVLGAFAAGELTAFEQEAEQEARARWPRAWKRAKETIG